MGWLPHVVATPPAAEPVTLAEARAQLSIGADDTQYDTELTAMIGAAIAHVETITGTKLVSQSVELQADCFADLARLPMAPLISVTELSYLDADGTEQVVDTSVYETFGGGRRSGVRLKIGQSWPATRCARDAVRVAGTFGYGAAAGDVPLPIKRAILLIIGDWFRDREDTQSGDTTSIPHGVKALLANYSI